MLKKNRGCLLIIGGAEDKEGECEILREFFSLAGEEMARIVILSTASTDSRSGRQYQSIFTDWGAQEVRLLAIDSREAANSPENQRLVRESTGIFFTGGDQLRITGILGGSVIGETLQQIRGQGCVIAGTSAGASAMSETMLVGGRDDATPKKEMIRMAPGLGLLRDAVIDQHFAQRGRIGRLLAVVAHNPFKLGVGIDEDTALVVGDTGECLVAGSGTVTVIDGQDVGHSNVSESSPVQSLALTNVRLHLLSKGYGFHLIKRSVRMPVQ